MKMTTAVSSLGRDYRPRRVMDLMRAIKSELDLAHHRNLSYSELGMYSGQSSSTAFDRLQRQHQSQVEALLSWLERIPGPSRCRLIDSVCRVYPTLEHIRISHDPTQVGLLRNVLSEPAGLSIIHGSNASVRTFLALAIGHTHRILHPEKPEVVGIDAYEPDWFVPLPEVAYIPHRTDSTHWKSSVVSALNRICNQTACSPVILNGVWPVAGSRHDQIDQLIARTHVIVADEFEKPFMFRRPNKVRHIIRVMEDREGHIRVVLDASTSSAEKF